MPAQVLSSVENNFTKGLITESTGLNFPENAATDCDNCEFTIVGDVLRREGITTEVNGSSSAIVTRAGSAVTTYKWNNAGGDGNTQILVVQVGATISFYSITNATATAPLSTTKLASTVDISTYVANGGAFTADSECTYADGNGYLFIFNSQCDPVYVQYSAGVLTGAVITIQIRDFLGVPEGTALNERPVTLTDIHSYNLSNQGWITSAAWVASSNTKIVIAIGSKAFTVGAGIVGVTPGQIVTGSFTYDYHTGSPPTSGGTFISGTVTSYAGTTLTVNVTSVSGTYAGYDQGGSSFFGATIVWTIAPTSTGYINTWNTAEGNYPSNADVWWYFKNTSGVFAPATTQPNVSVSIGQAPQGHFLLSAFQQDRNAASGLATITSSTTTVRPTTGAWFQGRVWYTGVNASQVGSSAYNWSEDIYFSQINTGNASAFGYCYQVNDPTSETLFDLLPTDGGVIKIIGCGGIYKLFPIQNGMLVFARNGVWFITGSQGIGFSANDYTITKLSNVEAISNTSFVDVMGLPYFWNEEGIYSVTQQQQGGLSVNPITVGTILSFYNEIPKQSKKYARGAYHPIDYNIQWIYKSTNESSVTDRYAYDSILNFNVYNKAFFPYSVDISNSSINGINFIQGPGGSTSPDPAIKYFSSTLSGTYSYTFADEHDTDYVDWGSKNYTSFFITGYKIHGQGQKRFQMPYIYTFSRGDEDTSFYIQGLWDYATDRNSNRWSSRQFVENMSTHFGVIFRRHRLRGQGLVLQIKITSVDGEPFDLMGWSTFETMNLGV